MSKSVRKIKQADYLPYGRHPIVDQGKKLIAAYSNTEEGLFSDVPAIVFGDHTRCVKYVSEPFFAGADGVKILKPLLSDNVRYWYHALKSVRLESLGYSRHYKLLKQKTFACADEKRQLAICEVLDATLMLANHARRQLSLLDDLVKSRFVETFGDGEAFHRVFLSDCVESIDSGKSPKCESRPREGLEPGVLKLSAISSGTYLENENKSLPSDAAFASDREVVAGDILMARKNTPELVGKCVLVHETSGHIMFPDIIFRMHPTCDVEGTYLSHLLSGPLLHDVRCLAHGSARSMSNIPKSELARLSIPIPPLALQREFAAFAERAAKSQVVVRRFLLALLKSREPLS